LDAARHDLGESERADRPADADADRIARGSRQLKHAGTIGGEYMATVATSPERRTSGSHGKLVEMVWDPITRIVGSLGLYTKIDFEKREVAECFSTSSIFRGYSIFMKG